MTIFVSSALPRLYGTREYRQKKVLFGAKDLLNISHNPCVTGMVRAGQPAWQGGLPSQRNMSPRNCGHCELAGLITPVPGRIAQDLVSPSLGTLAAADMI